MRVVLVYQHFLVSGVGSTKPYDLARHLVRSGHDVTVICGRGFLCQGMDVPPGLVRELDIDGIHVICLGVDYQQRMGFARRVAAFLAFSVLAIAVACFLARYDVMLASSTPLTVGLVALAARYVRRIPYVFEVRDLWPEVPYRAGYLKSRALLAISTFFEEWFYREAQTVTLVGRRMCRRLIERGVPEAKVRFLPTGASLGGDSAGLDEGFRRQTGLDEPFLAVYIGAHGPLNGLGYLLDAAERLGPEDGIRIVVIGDGAEKARLVEDARRRGLGQITFLPPVRHERVLGILRACDVALMIDLMVPGAEYALPNKFFDYLAAGVCVLSDSDAELWDFLRERDCGVLVSPDRPEELVDALRSLKAHPRRLREMGRRCRKLAEDVFDRRILHQQWTDVLAAAARPGQPTTPGA